MRTNVPIYRAKSNEGKNNYVEGFLIGLDEEIGLCTIRTKDDYIGGEICYLHTLAIHLPDMLDSQGNKIFASLQEDGIGGDMVDLPDYLKAEKGTERIAVIVMKSFNEYKAFCKNGAIYGSGHFIGNSKVIGIQE